MPGYPYTTWIGLISMIVIILSMPFIPGQTSGLVAGIVMVVFFYAVYFIMKQYTARHSTKTERTLRTKFSEEFSGDLTKNKKGKQKNERCR